MDKKQLIGTAITMLQSVDPDTIEVINFDRTEYDDGSVGFSVNLTTPPEKEPTEHEGAYREMSKLTDFILKEFPREPGKDGLNESAAEVAIRLLDRLKPRPVDKLQVTDVDYTNKLDPVFTFDFKEVDRYVVIDLGEFSGFGRPKRTLTISGPLKKVYQTEKL